MLQRSWTFLGNGETTDHRVFRLRRDRYRFEPTGDERDFVVIDSASWVNVVPVTTGGNVVLIRQFRHGIRDVVLEIPGGMIDGDEDPAAAAARELREETGYVADNIRLLARVLPNPAVQNNFLYLFAAEDFIKRLGARYDGHPDIDHLDLGSVGWWGEWHLSRSKKCKLPSLENRRKVVDAYFAAFQKTPLVMLLNGQECTTYAAQQGAGWRADSLGDLGSFSPTWNHMRNAYPSWIRATKVQEVWKTAPIAYEPPMEVREFTDKGWPLRWIFNYGLACHGSYFNGKSGKLPDDDNFRKELVRFLRRLGYRLVVKELRHPAQVAAAGKLTLAMKWQNVGSASCYKPYRVAYRLSNENGYSKVFVSNVTVNRWLPGSIDLFTDDFFKEPKDLPPGDIVDVTDTFALPAGLGDGQYTLSTGIVDGETPVLRLGIKGRGDDGWYPLSKVDVVK